jgi:hypothetical protein
MPKQLDLLAARAARDQALDAVASPSGVGSWINAVLKLIRSYPRGRRFTTDTLWVELRQELVARPSEPRAMGAAMVAARREGLATPTGDYEKSARVVNHARPVAIWVRR